MKIRILCLNLTNYCNMIDYKEIITIDPGKRFGKPCIRNMRITVYDVLGWLASGMTREEIIKDFPVSLETFLAFLNIEVSIGEEDL